MGSREQGLEPELAGAQAPSRGLGASYWAGAAGLRPSPAPSANSAPKTTRGHGCPCGHHLPPTSTVGEHLGWHLGARTCPALPPPLPPLPVSDFLVSLSFRLFAFSKFYSTHMCRSCDDEQRQLRPGLAREPSEVHSPARRSQAGTRRHGHGHHHCHGHRRHGRYSHHRHCHHHGPPGVDAAFLGRSPEAPPGVPCCSSRAGCAPSSLGGPSRVTKPAPRPTRRNGSRSSCVKGSTHGFQNVAQTTLF